MLLKNFFHKKQELTAAYAHNKRTKSAKKKK